MKFEEPETTQLHSYFPQGIHLDDVVEDAVVSATSMTRGDTRVPVQLTSNAFHKLRNLKKTDFISESPATGLLKFEGVTILNGKFMSLLKIECPTWFNFLATTYLPGNHFVD
jgi:hypothetical protein